MLFINSVFPTRLSSWDFRHYIGLFREEDLLDKLHDILKAVHKHGFNVSLVEPRGKDGGVFVKFKYTAPSADKDSAVQDIVEDLRREARKHGGVPSWIGVRDGDFWPVLGKPWREDLHRYASPILKISYDGPDVREEDLYGILRPFGKIADITPPSPAPAGTMRSTLVSYMNLRSSIIAHNCIHGLAVPSGSSGSTTKLLTMFERPIKAHVIRDWTAAHPRIVVPILVFLLGSLTYTIFDPIRAFMVEGRLLGWFDLKSSSWFQWIKEKTIQSFSFALKPTAEEVAMDANIWKEREAAERDVMTYLSDFPNTVTFVHGPQGSGKTRMLRALLKDVERPVLMIDCAEIFSAGSDGAVLQSLSRQTGYKPVFPFVNSLNNLIDIASVGLIGQKAGLSTSLTEQVKEMLQVIGTALVNTSKRKQKAAEHKTEADLQAQQEHIERARRQALLRLGTWHDGRLDCVAGNGVMSELGVGDERMRLEDYDVDPESVELAEQDAEREATPTESLEKTPSDMQALQTMPIVVIKNYATKRGRDDIIAVMSTWAASLVDHNIAHVIVLSDNRENAKQLAQALPSKPLHSVALSDADSSSALSFVQTKLKADKEVTFTVEQMKAIEKLGGRASDLETLVHKVRSGQGVQEAVEDIISRSTNELRKNAFGEDADDEKSLPWTRVQAWHVLKLLSKKDEVSYHDLLLEFPFKENEMALRNMEHGELITIVTQNGRPSAIRPGKPVYRYVFQRLVGDPVFRSLQDISFNEKKIASAESTVRSCEEELLKLKEIGTSGAHWWSKKPATAYRSAYIMRKMLAAESSIEKLEATNAELKKVLAKCE
ncbi:hypothetical protein SCHPADRAFT_914661 [Schizopora paradoxa]|uniref:Mitochondrial escape protein 2 n=1 Tax=Schizopora paradoxa TaxID=27342 RepID=A0A0H2RSM5_9AGAM|nr:hypothetical protein SCHPADRAFT_914661 [Schizopora paradoxa]